MQTRSRKRIIAITLLVLSFSVPGRIARHNRHKLIQSFAWLNSQEGFLSCAYFHAATDVGDRLTDKMKDVKIDVSAYVKAQWQDRLNQLQQVTTLQADPTEPPSTCLLI